MWCNLSLDGQSVMLGEALEPERVGDRCGDDEAGEDPRQTAEAFREQAWRRTSTAAPELVGLSGIR